MAYLPLEDFNLIVCPLTGISIPKGSATIETVHGGNVLYSFKPVGKAFFDPAVLKAEAQVVASGVRPLTDWAGLCRAADELGLKVPIVDGEPMDKGYTVPGSFEEKQNHFLRLFYETGGREHKKRKVFIEIDFPLAFANDAQEFSEILESLIDEKLLRYDNPNDIPNDWVGGLRTHYYGMLLTPNGKRKAKELTEAPDGITTQESIIIEIAPTITHAPSLAHLHPTVQQAAGSLFATNHYPQAIQSACTALEKAIQQKGGQAGNMTGTALIGKVFPKDNPLVSLSDDQGEREGYGFLYRGLLQAIRNHYAHNLTPIPAPRALEWLAFISALFYKLDEAQPPTA